MPRIKTVEHEQGWGWIARDPHTGTEIVPEFRWISRRVARTIVDMAKRFHKASQPAQG